MTAKAAVVGWPIAHALSPVLHTYWLREHGIDGRYDKIAIEPGTFAQRIAELRDAGYRGVNVTVPFKEEAFALADDNDDAARATGATNLLVFHDGGIEGRNTDALGLAESLRETIGTLEDKTVILLGAGGAARGAVLALSMLDAAIVNILNRNPQRAHDLLQSLMDRETELECALFGAGLDAFCDVAADAGFRTGGLDDWKTMAADADLVVNTTSAGMKGNPPLDIDLSMLPKTAAVCDIVYNPLQTPLLKEAAARGHQTIDGLGMLMHQAAPSFEAFFGTKPQVTPQLRAALVKELQARG